MNTYLVRHKNTGLLYRLVDNGDGIWIMPNDGVVPSSQRLNGTLDSILADYSLEIVHK